MIRVFWYFLYYAAKEFRFNTIVFSHDLVIFDTLRSQVVTLPRERAKSMLYAAGKLLLEGCSTEGLPLLIRYLKQTVKESETAGESVGDGATGRLALVQGVVDALEIVQNHHITEMLKAEMEQLPKIEGRLLLSGWTYLVYAVSMVIVLSILFILMNFKILRIA